MDDVIIIGAGGHGKVVLDILLAEGEYRPVGFVDNNPSLLDSYVCGLPVLGPINALPRLKRQKIRHAIIAIGDNRQRLAQREFVDRDGVRLVNAVHPTAFVSPKATLGRGVVVAPGAKVVVAGAAVIHDVPDGATAVGVPANVIKSASPAPSLVAVY